MPRPIAETLLRGFPWSTSPCPRSTTAAFAGPAVTRSGEAPIRCELDVSRRGGSVELAALELDRVRRGIPLAIDNEVPGLDHPITASAGLAKVDPADPKASYREADLLLYNAKRSGRDQLCFDRRDPLRETREAAPLLGPQLNLSRKVS